MGLNSKSKSLAGRFQRSTTYADRLEHEASLKEEQYWREAEGAKSRAAKKHEEEAIKRAEAVAKKAEARRLAKQEEDELARSMPKSNKVTEAELLQKKEEDEAALKRRVEEEEKKRSRVADPEEYERRVNVLNTNRDDSVIEARTLEDAIAQITVLDTLPADKHPEKRLKVSFQAFEEAEILKLKEEKPGLTLNQYKAMVCKLWKKSPDNPLNHVTNMFKMDKGLINSRDCFDSYEILKSDLDEYGYIITEPSCSQASDLEVDLAGKVEEGEITVTPAKATLMDFIKIVPQKKNRQKAIC